MQSHDDSDVAGLTLTQLQQDGASAATAVMLRYGGVIVADSVGMGKTYIALKLIADALARDWDVAVIVPATLRRKWRAALTSIGTGDDNDRAVNGAVQRVILTSHSLVARLPLGSSGSTRLVVVDEAHQFRNPATSRYRSLARLTASGHVLLLTATPINNRPADLYWLLRLFMGDGTLAGAGVPDLRAALLTRAAHDDELIRRAARATIVRRTREDYAKSAHSSGDRLTFPRRHPPRAVPYQPDVAELFVLTEVERTFPLLRFTAFDIPRQPASQTGRHTAMLVRYGLLKRLESGSHAFRSSILRLLRFFDAFADAVAGGGYVLPADVRMSDPLQLSLSALVSRRLPRSMDRDRLAADVAHDCELLRHLLSILPCAPPAKLQALIDLLGSLGGAKAVVFTEFAETAEALFGALPQSGTALLHGAGARLASGPAGRHVVLELFAPLACGATPPPAHQAIQVLIATDVLAEGVDLQDASHCISYDLPWNPVRLMQRAGRIDRLGSPHPDVFTWYFEPPNEIERWIGLMRRLGIKLRTISSSVGAEHGAVLGSSRSTIVDSGTHVSDERTDGAPSGSGESYATLRTRLLAMLRHPSWDFSNVSPLVQRRQSAHSTGAAAISVSDRDFASLLALSDSQAAHAFRAEADHRVTWIMLVMHQRNGTCWVDCRAAVVGRSIAFDPSQTLQALSRLGEVLMGGEFEIVDDPSSLIQDAVTDDVEGSMTGGSAFRRVGNALLYALAHDPAASDPAYCARADRILEQLRAGLRAGIAREISSALAATNLRDLLDRLEAVLGTGSDVPERNRLATVLLVLPDGTSQQALR